MIFPMTLSLPTDFPRRVFVSDVHGHYDGLVKLFEAIAPNDQDKIYFVGDLIDRGPDSAKVVDFVIKNKYECILGNHEQMLLDTVGKGNISSDFLQAWLFSGGQATLESYNFQIPQEHIDWMQHLPLYLDLDDIWLVHAGVDPTRPLEKQTEEQFCWIRDEFHECARPYFNDKLIITGHTITFTFPGVEPGQLVAGAGWLDIETGAYHPKSGWLTAIELTQRLVYQVHCISLMVRTIPLDEAVVFLNPELVSLKRSRRKFS